MLQHQKLKVVPGDVTDKDTLKTALEGCQHVINAASGKVSELQCHIIGCRDIQDLNTFRQFPLSWNSPHAHSMVAGLLFQQIGGP